MRPCPTAGREPSLSNCRKDIICREATFFLSPAMGSGASYLPSQWPVSWSGKRDHHSASLLSLSPGHVSQTQASGSPRPGSSLVKDTRTFLGPSCKRWRGGVFQDPHFPSLQPQLLGELAVPPPPPTCRVPLPPLPPSLGPVAPGLPHPNLGLSSFGETSLPGPAGLPAVPRSFSVHPAVPSHPTPQGQPTHRTLLSRQEE